MRQLGRRLFLLFQLICFAALLYELSVIAAVIFASMPDVCPVFNEGGIRCTTPTYTAIGKYGMTGLLISVFAPVPTLLAIIGLVFAVRALIRWRRGRAPTAPPASATTPPQPAAPSPTPAAVGAKKKWRLPKNPWLRFALFGLVGFLTAGFIAGIIQRIAG